MFVNRVGTAVALALVLGASAAWAADAEPKVGEAKPAEPKAKPGKKFVAGDAQYTRERGSRIFSSSIVLGKPEFDVRKHYMMTIETRGRVIAMTQFWLLGKGEQHSGKVEFSDAEAKAK